LNRLAACLVFVASLSLSVPVGAQADLAPSERKSSYEMMGAQSRSMQDDDMANPAMLSVLDGEALWRKPAGEDKKSCADCHGDARQSMRGMAARYPSYDVATRRVVDLEERINLCQAREQKSDTFGRETKDMLALSAYLALQSRGMPIAPSQNEALERSIERGRAAYFQRQGQLNLSCANCHDDNWSRKLGGATIPQGHPTGYPIYRLEWNGVGSLQRRLRNCLTGMRAQVHGLGAPELTDLEAYLMWRARGMPMDAPAVRP
jgi:sulfur-oxidizing protein SoxA